MNVTIEISKYPLNEEYIKPIKNFIDRINTTEGIIVKTNATSTQIAGEYDFVMNLMSQEIKCSFEQFGKSIFVMKVLLGNLIED
ncbi:YkoF family thiamine/hydroxymethylpyrimidine-binding protein [Parvicella tangerina]|uniref:Thiamin/hydroxymethyl pyrimidine-binding YkoF putative domain-containing protein n=1 Tax=Parvicella tangerina TaxID=2829795 RepID=A0A916NGK6_9FLAO|nr:YkoF family thiamine/hydroxymethylpyrimidine-binding protein [Parvicella tangerina]CAG5079932.1 hypothetical protein CRYO30217_01124 [Parvicella tangerina]